MKRPQRSSVQIAVEVEAGDGTRHRLDSDTLKPADRPTGISMKTQRGDGFAEAGFALKRSVLRDYPDLEIGNTVRMIGAEGQILHEGYIASLSREVGDDGQSISIPVSGWMSHARDRRFREIYIDRDLNRFAGEPPLPRQAALLGGATKYRLSAGSAAVQSDPDGNPAVRLSITRLADTATNRANAECWYDAGGIAIAKVIGDGYLDSDATGAPLAAPLATFAGLVDAPVPTDLDLVTLTGTSAAFEVTATDPKKTYALLQLVSLAAAPTTLDGEWDAWFRGLAAIGAHGLTMVGGGYTASDVIADIARRFCPLFDLSAIQQTTYPLRQIAYHEPTYPHDAFLELNKAHLWELSVWEGRRFHFEPPLPLDEDFDWQVRTDDPGVRMSFGGDVISEMGNGVEVRFTDLLTGTTQTITPLDYPDELRDTNPDNPLNRAGRDKWLSYDVPFPCLEADAVQYGRAYFAEATRAKSPVSITAGYHVRDAAGNWRPAAEVRCGQRIAITDHPNSAPRRIIDTSYTHDGRGLTISADRASQHLSAIVDRITLARTAASLS